ncbi:hypothetical protein K502DRAFT_349360 [Neoconidiobolus thromboides FSU 785]|nr:hypothetical protein K502DRAFT_349360 [Neoconidiobolus thromboides FSU 785]
MDPSIILNNYSTGLNTRFTDYQFDNDNSNKSNLQSNFTNNVRVDKLAITQKKQETVFSENPNKSQSTATQLSLKKAKLALKISVILISYMLCLLPDYYA